MQHHLKNFYTKLAFKKFGKMSQLILQFRKEKELYAVTSESPKEKLTPAEKKFLKENNDIYSYYQYDPLFGLGIGDLVQESEFLLKEYDPKSKTVHLKDKYEEEFVIDGRKNYQGGTEIVLKLVKQNGKWLIDESKIK